MATAQTALQTTCTFVRAIPKAATVQGVSVQLTHISILHCCFPVVCCCSQYGINCTVYLLAFCISACNSASCPKILNSTIFAFKFPEAGNENKFKCMMIMKRNSEIKRPFGYDSLSEVNLNCQLNLRGGEPSNPLQWSMLPNPIPNHLYRIMQKMEDNETYHFHGGFRLTFDYYVAKQSRILLNWGRPNEFSFTLRFPIEVYKNGNLVKNRTASMTFSPMKEDPVQMSTIFDPNDYKTTIVTSREDKRPYCRSFILHADKMTYGKLQPCEGYNDWEYFVCEAKQYKDCIVEYLPPCYQLTENQTECYKMETVITQHPELPYGKPCPSLPLEKCEKCMKCVNTTWSQWGLWSSNCNTATRERWRTRDLIPYAVCKITPEDCCFESEEKIFEKKCETIFSQFVRIFPYTIPAIIAFSLGIVFGGRQMWKFEKFLPIME
ncbi:conserved hypothetical protein [Trichinella spiralis]|uniref:hypothetical protein n=1 Tax=Trichinella spiralis TaxID=6334 RepID=UPI0001EFE3D0|nr:conserved hypothetical protein [Trichinella spiralis]